MNDLIFRACSFQVMRFVDRTAVLGVSRDEIADVKERSIGLAVVLLTDVRNLLPPGVKAPGVMAPLSLTHRVSRLGNPKRDCRKIHLHADLECMRSQQWEG